MRRFLHVLLVLRVFIRSSAFGGVVLQMGREQQASSVKLARVTPVHFEADTSGTARQTLILAPTSAPTNGQNTVQIAALSVILPILLMNMLPPALYIGMDQPYVKAEILNDMSHVALDLLAYFTPETLVLRLAGVIGRILCMASDYVQDETVAPRELVFQCSTLAVSMGMLLKSAFPLLHSSSAEASFRDRVAYQVLFRPVGLSWLQFRAVAATAVDWIEVDPNTTIDPTNTEVEYSYWLYKGDANISCNGSVVQQLSRRKRKNAADSSNDVGLLAHEALARLAEESKYKEKPSKTRVRNDITPYHAQTRIQVGSEGATLLRIDARKLIQLMNDDENLDSSVRKLLLKGMHRRLKALIATTVEEMSVSN